MVYRIVERSVACGLLALFAPVGGILYVLVKLDSKGPFFFTQERIGKGFKPFRIYKIRTMRVGAESQQNRYCSQNEADGPVFKIRNDPRFTRVGRFLSHTAIDEIPQLINVIRGEMAFVGPRPLPKYEAKKVPKQYQARFGVLPGMTSLWVVRGAHNLSFKEWMESDCEYVKDPSPLRDLFILARTSLSVAKAFRTHFLKK